MPIRYKETEYMYSSARLRSMETILVDKEMLFRITEADTVRTAAGMLSECGFDVKYREDGTFLREKTLTRRLESAYAAVCDMECRDAVRFMQYRYDCNNLKVLLKCGADKEKAGEMLLPLGSVGIQDTQKAFADRDYSCFPHNMANAVREAEESLLSTSSVQGVDFIMDRACFADMKEAAEQSGIELAVSLVRIMADLANVQSVLRLFKMKRENTARGLLEASYLLGGGISNSELLDALDGGEDELCAVLRRNNYDKLALEAESGAPLWKIEKSADDIIINEARRAKFLPFGAEVAIGYINAVEYEVKNLRIIFAAKNAGLDGAAIRERLRESYV